MTRLADTNRLNKLSKCAHKYFVASCEEFFLFYFEQKRKIIQLVISLPRKKHKTFVKKENKNVV